MKIDTKAYTVNATKRLQTKMESRQRVLALELPKFRYLDDVTRFVDQIENELKDYDNLIKVQQKALAFLLQPRAWVQASLVKAATFEFNVSDDAGTKKSHLKKKIDPELTKVVIPKLKDLTSQYNMAEDLYEKHRVVEMAETQIAMQFPDRRGPDYEAAMSGIAQLKANVQGKLKKVLGFLSDVAEAHIPKTFKTYMQAVVKEVEEHVQFESNQVFLYVSTSPEGEIVFTYYLMLENAMNDDGKVTPHLYISLQWVVGGAVYVHVNHEYELPNQLLKGGGNAVESVGSAVKELSELLDMEDFATALGTVPLATQLRMDPSKITENMFTYRDFIKKVEIDQNELVFVLRPGVSQEQIDEIKIPLFQEVKALFNNSRKMKIKMSTSTKFITFTLSNVAQAGEVSYDQAEFLRDRFNLNETQLRKFVKELNKTVHEHSEE
jgi:hypothetical protein